MVYFLKINVAIALFYAFYRLFFYKDTFFGWRRTALLCFFAVSVVVPLLDIQNWIEQQEPMAAMVDLYASVVCRKSLRPYRKEQTGNSCWPAACVSFTGWWLPCWRRASLSN